MSVRLSTGFCHGLLLQETPSGTRPTASRVRSAVWNALQETLPGARVLDVFAGSGAVGIEALSRGARAASFIENQPEALRALKLNLAEVQNRAKKQGIAIQVETFSQGAAQALRRCPSGLYDILWLDPPYASLRDLLPPLREDLLRVAAPGATLLVESDAASLDFVNKLFSADAWDLLKQKVYGKIAVNFFNHRQ